MNHLDKAVRMNARVLLSMVSGIREGRADAIHDARVATRRLRAALAIAWGRRARSELSEAKRALRRTGRALGRVRDLDVALAVLGGAELRMPAAARTVGQLRSELTSRQERERRRLIKRIEKFSPPEAEGGRHVLPAIEWRTDPRWRLLERALLQRAARLESAVEAAGGVYFPNRLHAVRLHAKRLRYLLELVPTASKDVQRAGKRLRKAQQVLGDLRDRQATADIVAEAASASGVGTPPGHSEDYQAVRNWLEADVRERHLQYLEHRAPLQEACAAIRHVVAAGVCRPWTVARALVTAGAFAAPSAAALLKRQLDSGRSRAGRAARPAPEGFEQRVERTTALRVAERANATPSA
jgi:CHAD domain-containing protein